MKNRILPLAAALALSSCAESSSCAKSFATHETDPGLVGKSVRVYFGPESSATGTLLKDGRLELAGKKNSVNWDRDLYVTRR